MYSIIIGLLFFTGFHNGDLIDSTEDEKKVKEGVISWCEKNLFEFEGKKFEKFHPFYTEEFEMESIKVEMYKSQLQNLERRKKMGKYTKSDEEYNKEKSDFEKKISDTKKSLLTFTPRATYYEISMWSNVKMKNGKPVFVQLYFKLNDNYEVLSHEIKSSIGGESDPSKNQIMFK